MTLTLNRITQSLATASVFTYYTISTAFAQTTGGGNQFGGPTPDVAGLPNTSNPDDVRKVVVSVLAAVLNFLALIAVVIVVIAGIRLIVSQGEDDAKDKAKKTIFYALAGLAIVLFARVIVGLITVYLASQVHN